MGDTMQQRLTQDLTQFLASLPEDDRIKAINEIRMAIHQVSPFREEPVDCVLWVKNSQLFCGLKTANLCLMITTQTTWHHPKKNC